MTSWIVSFSLLVCVVAIASAQLLPYSGTCPSFGPMSGLNPLGVLGRWYAVYAAKHGMPEENIRCVKNDYSLDLVHQTLAVTLTQTDNSNNSVRVINVQSAPVDPSIPTRAVIEGEMAEEAKPLTLYFTMMDTDYTHYLVTVICGTTGQNYGYGVQVYSRTTTLAPQYLDKAHQVMAQNGIPLEMAPVVQNCMTMKEKLDEGVMSAIGQVF